MRALKTFALATCTWLALAPVARAEVQVSIRNGRVSIVAKDATVRQILVEWARVGKTKIVNVERIPGGPLTLELKDVSEAEALDVLLRTLSGYMAAPRLTMAAADASVYDSIVVMPTTAAAAPRTSGSSNAPAPFAPAPAFNQNDDEDNSNAPARPGGAQAVRPPIFQTFPQPQVGSGPGARPMLPVVRPGIVQPNAQGGGESGQGAPPVTLPPPSAPSPAPSAAPFGAVSAPGMIAPAASQPGQVVQPQRPPGE
jgi:hypothetical protein